MEMDSKLVNLVQMNGPSKDSSLKGETDVSGLKSTKVVILADRYRNAHFFTANGVVKLHIQGVPD